MTYAKLVTKVQLAQSPRKNLCQTYEKFMPKLYKLMPPLKVT